MRRIPWLFVALGLFAISPSQSYPKIAPIPLKDRVAKADFVGIVECETAGAVVAKYKVIESVRGAKAGEQIYIRTFVRGVGPQFRISLVGERFLAIAPRAAPYEEWSRFGSGGTLGWRRLPADYDVPYGQGPTPMNAATAQIYEDAKKLVAASPKPEFKLPVRQMDYVWQEPGLPKPTDAQIEAWRKMLGAGPVRLKDDLFKQAKEGLYAYAPTPFFNELLAEAPPEKLGLRPTEMLYAKASYAAWKCGQEREKHLKLLLTAKEPLVRVTGAVYLCFENEKVGREALKKLTDLPLEPGAWAALALARRGDKTAVPRVLELFDRMRDFGSVPNLFNVNLRLNAQVLLSNSALKSDVPQPPRAAPNRPWGHEVDYDELSAWWRQHSAKITLHDPWLDTLSKQKID